MIKRKDPQQIEQMKAAFKNGLTVGGKKYDVQIVLKDSQGSVIPEGSSAVLNGNRRQNAIVGFDGMVYFETLEEHNTLRVSTHAGACEAQFDYPQAARDIPQIGPITCR